MRLRSGSLLARAAASERFRQFIGKCLLSAVASAMSALSSAEPAGPAASAAPASLVVHVLGSGGPGAVGRAASSHLVLIDGVPRILVDAGPGSFARLGESGLSLREVDVILLTHLHADHVSELPGLLKARAVSTGAPIEYRVFGPAGRAAAAMSAAFPSTSRWMDLLFGKDGAFAYLPSFSAPMKFRVTDLPVEGEDARGVATIVEEDGIVVRAIAGHHGDAPAIAYRIDYKGHSVTFSGDMDADGHAALRRVAAHTDLLVFNAVVLDPPDSPARLYALHTAPADIGAIAADTHAKRVLLAHLSPAVDGNREDVLASIARRYRGPVTFAEDGVDILP